MGKLIKMAWRNMWRNWRRTAIASVAIVLGMILLLFMGGVIHGTDQVIFGNAVRLYGGNIQIHAPGYLVKASRMPLLPLEDANAVVQAALAQPHVLAAAKRINTGGVVSSREGAFPVAITGVEPSVEAPHSIQANAIVEGRYLLDEDLDAVLIGKGLADLLDVGVGDRVTVLGRVRNESMRQRTMTIVGIFDVGMPELEKAMTFITLTEAQELYGLSGQATEVAVTLEQVGQEPAVLPGLRAALPGYEVDAWDTLRPEMRETMQTKGMVTTFFAFVVLFIASIGVLNLMLMAVYERTREMGVLAALGMKGRQIMLLFLLEGALIGAFAAAIGVALGMALVGFVGQVGIAFNFAESMGGMASLMGDRLYTSYPLSDAIGRGVSVTLISALASLYPAWQAVRKEPAEALHHI